MTLADRIYSKKRRVGVTTIVSTFQSDARQDAPTGRAPNGRAPPRRAPTQESARRRVPGGPCLEGWINFPFPASIPVCTLLVKWSQLGGSELNLGISPLINGSSPSQDCSPTCKNIILSDRRLQVQYKEESLSAIGSSKTLLQHLQAYSYSEATTSNYPYKTSIQECFEHCLGTVLSYSQGACYDPAVSYSQAYFSSFGRALLLRLLTRLLSGACYDPAVSYSQAYFSSFGRALLLDYSHGYSQVLATILQSPTLKPTSPPLDARSYSTTHTATLRCFPDYDPAVLLLSSLLLLLWTRAPTRLLTRLLSGACYDPAVSYSQAYFSSFGRALLLDYSHGYSQVLATILQSPTLKPTSPPLDARSYSTTHTATLRCLLRSCSLLLSSLLLLLWTRAPTRLLTRLLSGACYDPAVSYSQAYFSSFGRALLLDYSHGYSQVLATILQSPTLKPTSPPLDARSYSTTHTATLRCLLRSCSLLLSSLLLLLWTRAPTRLLTRLLSGGLLDCLGTVLSYSQGACYDPAVSYSQAYFSSFGRALLLDYSHGYSQVLATILQSPTLKPTSPPLDARSYSTTHTATLRCLLRSCSLLLSSLLLLLWTRAPTRLLTRLLSGACYDPAVSYSQAYFSSFGRALLLLLL